jgi:Aspartyl protease
MQNLEFSHVYSYSSRVEGIALPVVLRSGDETVDLLAHVDTGASHCLFEREHGEMLNLEIERGDPKSFSTATGRLDAFGHLVSLEVLDLRFESMVYFFADPGISKNLLGRGGWLNRIRFGLVDHDHRVYFAAYDFQPGVER